MKKTAHKHRPRWYLACCSFLAKRECIASHHPFIIQQSGISLVPTKRRNVRADPGLAGESPFIRCSAGRGNRPEAQGWAGRLPTYLAIFVLFITCIHFVLLSIWKHHSWTDDIRRR